MSMIELSVLEKRIGGYRPSVVGAREVRSAAVSLILKNGQDGADMLFIERAKRRGDPWSGQMAFPGGKKDPADASAGATARRETFEEIGLELSSHRYVGRLDDLVAPPSSPASGLVVSCLVHSVTGDIEIDSNEEVHDTIWIPVASLISERNFLPSFQPIDYQGTFPGIRVAPNDSRVIWGLTYRFLLNFCEVCDLAIARKLP